MPETLYYLLEHLEKIFYAHVIYTYDSYSFLCFTPPITCAWQQASYVTTLTKLGWRDITQGMCLSCDSKMRVWNQRASINFRLSSDYSIESSGRASINFSLSSESSAGHRGGQIVFRFIAFRLSCEAGNNNLNFRLSSDCLAMQAIIYCFSAKVPS